MPVNFLKEIAYRFWLARKNYYSNDKTFNTANKILAEIKKYLWYSLLMYHTNKVLIKCGPVWNRNSNFFKSWLA